jgi:hypothetical protein
MIEDPCSKQQGIFDRKECGLFYDSLAFAVQRELSQTDSVVSRFLRAVDAQRRMALRASQLCNSFLIVS